MTSHPVRRAHSWRTRVRPLSPGVYLLRNKAKTLPLTGVVLLAVMLIAGIVSMIDSIPLSVRTIYGYSRFMLGISPRGDPTLTPHLMALVDKGSPVEIERTTVCRVSSTMVQSIVGKWPFAVIGLGPGDLRYFLQRIGASSVSGRLPGVGKPEVLVSDPIARNLGLRLGSTLLSPDNKDSYSPLPVKVVGIAHTSEWVILNDIEYQRAHHFPMVDAVLVFAKTLPDQDKLDRWAFRALAGERAQPFAYFDLERRTNDDVRILYRILSVVIGTLVLVITLMMGMLMNIYQSQRLIEYGLLQAIGHTRRGLLRRALAETAVILALGWLLGLGASLILLKAVDASLMAPHAFVLNTFDPNAVLYTASVPLAVLVVGFFTVLLRFRRFDPVGVLERRLV